ncbi:unnamed protein product [Allacma fusca]|uniref:DEP domain-containing protein n=1 Tax=Allacma fusca TaxID=39272 RepID=A0A8J2P9H6_9HEXA|nr:unnamed protein product [Allacma fusca]
MLIVSTILMMTGPNQDGRVGDHVDKLGVTYTDMDSAIAVGESHSRETGASANRDQTPNHIVYRKMEKMVEKMQDENAGVPVRTVKTFLNKIPSVFTGSDLICWIAKHLDVEDQSKENQL